MMDPIYFRVQDMKEQDLFLDRVLTLSRPNT
jgi:hypothetical protein